MIRLLCLIPFLTVGLVVAQDTKKDGPPAPPKPQGQPQVIRLAVPAPKPAGRALEWSLTVDPLDQQPGNAAPLWLRAGGSARAVRYGWTNQEFAWGSGGVGGTALMDLPRADVRALLKKYDAALRIAELASLRARCDWEYPPLTIQNIPDIPHDDIQAAREVVRLLSLRCRVELSDRNFDTAIKDLRVGLALGKHLCDSEYLIQDLVGIAITAIMFSRVEEWMEVPGSPNLYWPLTELPRPLVDVRKTIRSELNTIYRSFPSLRELKAKKLSAEEAQALVERFFQQFQKMVGNDVPGWQTKLGTAALAMKYYPTAKKELIARGRTEKEVDAMPTVQVVALFYLEEYDRVRDEIVKLLQLPLHQSYPEFEKIDKVEVPKARANGNFPLAQLMPSLTKTLAAQSRTERNIAGYRAAEALRMHIGLTGKVPAKWADITAVPLPTDPFTGKGFDAWYSVKDGKAVLDVPPPPGMPAILGKRYEFIIKES